MATKAQSPKPLPRSDYADFAIALVSGLILAITSIFFISVLFSGKLAGSRDFVSYWSTGVQLRHHADPYNWDQMMALEHAAHLDADGVLFMRNPPWGLPLAYPLGFLELRIGAFLWSVLLLGCAARVAWYQLRAMLLRDEASRNLSRVCRQALGRLLSLQREGRAGNFGVAV